MMKNIVAYPVLEKELLKMYKNLSVDIAKLFNLDIGETFEIEGYSGVEFYFNDNGLFGDNGKEVIQAREPLVKIILGEAEIKRKPFIPNLGDVYWTFSEKPNNTWSVHEDIWKDTVFDHAVLKSGWVFKTKEEAVEALPKVTEERGVDYFRWEEV